MAKYTYKVDPALVVPKGALTSPDYSPAALCFLVWIQIMFVTLVYAPIPAFLTELFPTRIRYTSLSIPYHIGNGIFGGIVPVVGLSIIQSTHNNYSGLWYPISIVGVCFLIMLFFVPETYRNKLEDVGGDLREDNNLPSDKTETEFSSVPI